MVGAEARRWARHCPPADSRGRPALWTVIPAEAWWGLRASLCKQRKAGRDSELKPSICGVPWSVKRSPSPTLPLLASFSAAHKNPWTYLGRTWGPKSLKPWGSAYLASWEGSCEEDGLGGLYCCRLGLSYILLAVLMWPKGQQSAH